MEAALLIIIGGFIAALPGILSVIAQKKKDDILAADTLTGRLQADNNDLREENRRLRAERDVAEKKIDELQIKLDEVGILLRRVQNELSEYKKTKGIS